MTLERECLWKALRRIGPSGEGKRLRLNQYVRIAEMYERKEEEEEANL